MKWALSGAYIGLAVLANWLASKYVWPVGFGYVAPAGVFAIGWILVARDWLQQVTSVRYTLALVPIGGGLSWLIGDLAGWTSLQRVAVASFLAFCISETVEAAVFTPLRKRSLTFGVLLSGTVGNALDSFIFVWIAWAVIKFPGATHGSLFTGNFVGKIEMIALGTALTAARRVRFPVVKTA